jgi:hypothetical protein
MLFIVVDVVGVVTVMEGEEGGRTMGYREQCRRGLSSSPSETSTITHHN